jgi:hypothetical protein
VAGRKKLQPERRLPMPAQARKLARETRRAVTASDGKRRAGKTIEEGPADPEAAGDPNPLAGHPRTVTAMFKNMDALEGLANEATPEERAIFWCNARPRFASLTSLFQATATIDAPQANAEAETKVPPEEPAAPTLPVEPALGTAALRHVTPPAEAEDTATPVAGDETTASVSDHDLRLLTCSGGNHIDGDRAAPQSTDAGKVAFAADEEARKAAVEELLDAQDDPYPAQGRKRSGLTRDPSRRSPRAVLGIPDDAPLTRQLIRAAFERREGEVWGDRNSASNHEVEPLEEARDWLLQEVHASEPEPRDNPVAAGSSGPVGEPVGPAA